MDFFDNLGSKLTQTGQKAKEMTNSLVESAKLTQQLNELNKALKELYEKVGERYCELHGDAPEEDLAELCAEVKGKKEEQQLLSAELQRVKNVRLCPECGQENPADVNFCAQCGAKLPELPKPPAPQTVFCPGCGAQLNAGMKFCTKCGTKLD